jgi:hypothetical protein
LAIAEAEQSIIIPKYSGILGSSMQEWQKKKR